MYIIAAFYNPLPWQEFSQDESKLMDRTKHYFYDTILSLTKNEGEFGSFHWNVFFAFTVGWILIFLCLKNGISTTGKIALFTVVAPYVLLMILLVKVLSLDGSLDGIVYMLKPDFSKLLNLKIWSAAVNQAFFQYSIGCGSNMTFASFRPTKKKIYQGSFFICCMNAFSSVFASMVVFGYLGFYTKAHDIRFEDLPIDGVD